MAPPKPPVSRVPVGAKKAPEKAPPPSAKEDLEKLARSGHVDSNDAEKFILDLRQKKPDRQTLKELKAVLLKHLGVFDRGAAHKLRAFFESYRAENDV